MMEEETERLTLNLNSKRRSKRRSSSILKTTIGPLLDIDPNKQDGCNVPLKKSRPSLSKRVSFARLLEVKEFPRDSPRRCEDSPAQEPATDTGNDTVPLTNPVTIQQDQHVTNVSEGQLEGSRMPLLPSMSAPHTENDFDKYSQHLNPLIPAMVETSGIAGTAVSSRQPQIWRQESKIDGSSLLKSITGTGTQPREGMELGYHTQSSETSSLVSKAAGSDTKVDGMALLQALGGGASNTSAEPELLPSYSVGDNPKEQSVQNTRAMMFSESRYMDQTKALTCHTQLREAEACLKGLRERTPLMALKDQAVDNVRYGVLNDDPGDKTIVFTQGDDMQQTEVLPVGLQLNSQPSDGEVSCLSGHVNRQSLLRSLGGSDETDSPEVLFAKKFETSNSNIERPPFKGYDTTHQREATIVFQQGLEMEETGVIHAQIDRQDEFLCANTSDNGKVQFYLGSDSEEIQSADMPMYRPVEQKTVNKTLIYQDGADMEQTEVLDSNINHRSLAQPPINQTMIQGADMDQTEVLDSKINHRSLTQPPINQTLIQGADMDQTEVLDSKINHRSLTQPPINQTLTQGVSMKQTGVISNNILSNTSTFQRSDSKTLIFQDGADMEQTGVISNNILSNTSTLQRSDSKTLIFQDGADMEQTGVISNNILSNTSTLQRSDSKTLIFQDGADMEQTGVISNNILSNTSTLQRSDSKTLIFQDGADMEQTGVISNNILSNTSTLQWSDSKTLIFQDGADMEETGVIDTKFINRSLVRPVNQTVMDGAAMEETGVIDAKITNRSLVRPANQTVMDGAAMEETGVIDTKITNRSLVRPVNQTIMDGAAMEETGVIDTKFINRSLVRPVNQTVMDGATMEETGVIDTKITNRSLVRPANQTVMDGAAMEETGVIDTKFINRSLVRPANQTVMDGAAMEETGVIDTKITNRSLVRPANQTVMDGAAMEETGVIDTKITNRSLVRPANQTVMDGAAMEETGVIDAKITNRSLVRPVNQTVMDGAAMEETSVIDTKITNRSLLRPFNQTVMDGAAMEETSVIDTKITNRSLLQPFNQTVMDGAAMEEISVIDTKITNRSLLRPGNQTVMDGADMAETEVMENKIAKKSLNIALKEVSCNASSSQEVCEKKTVVFHEGMDLDETHATTSNINIYGKGSAQTLQPVSNMDLDNTKMNKSSMTTSARLKRLSTRFSLGGDTVTGRLSLAGDNLTNRLTGESEVDGDQTSSIPRNTIRLAGPTPRKSNERTCDVISEGNKVDIPSQVTVESESVLQKTTAQVREDAPQIMETDEPCNHPVSGTGLDTKPKQTGEMDMGITEVLPPLDLGITDMLPPDDITTSMLHTSTTTDLPSLKKANNGPVERKDSSGSDSSQTQSVTSYSLVSNYSNYSMTESMLENTRREVDGPLTVKKLCLLLDIPCFRWLEFQVRNDRCSILPGEQVDTSDLRNVLRACAVQCPFYLVHSHIYTQAVRQADLKKEKAEELDILFTQEDSKPIMFRAVEHSTDQQRKTLREKVLACAKVSSLLGKAEWKKVRTQATVQYRETLKDQYSRLQSQASNVNNALQQSQGLLTALDTALSELETDETDLENTKLPTEQEIRQWNIAQQELSVKVSDLQHLEEKQTKLTSERDSIHSELAILRDRDQQLVNGQRQDIHQVLEKLESENSEIIKDLDWMKRCLEWRPDRFEKEAVSYLFYDDSLLLETTLDTSLHRRLLSATLTSTLQGCSSKPVSQLADKSEDIMGLIHRLIIDSVKEQNILTKFIGTPLKELYKFLRAVSMVVCTGRCLAQEITRIEFNNWVTIKEQGLSVEFWCDEARRKIDIDFGLKLKYRDYSVTPSVRVDIGNFRPEDVLKQLSAVPDMGFRYFERLCQAINLNDMTVVPELDRCS
ncbi:uncharacterized protein LOC117324137 [Pecten maximus]|uniref:uncharacterized protein LOC117324137 n=1 Tax=Pecten maximus TaxID=6579 RepID=UPI0014582C51|nr:uncharacterized protein LOC117324137 [Pecten maximus]